MFNAKFFREEDGSLYFSGDYLEVYIPKYYIEDKIAETLGNGMDTLGIFYFAVGKQDNKASMQLYKLLLPVSIYLEIPNRYEARLTLSKDVPEDDYVVLQFYNNDVFIQNLSIKKTVKNTEKFIKILHGGKLPVMSYEDLCEIYHLNLQMNGVNLGVKSVVLESILAELCRSKKDKAIAFRKEIGAGKAKNTDYQMINIKELPQLNSNFAAISFENMHESLVGSINRTVNKEKEIISPVEKVIKY